VVVYRIGAAGRGMGLRKEVMLECDVCIGQQADAFGRRFFIVDGTKA